MVATRAIAASLVDGVTIVVTNGSAVYHGYPTMPKFENALAIACRGVGNKSFATGPLNANVVNVTAGTAAPGFPTWGFRIRLTGSPTNYARRLHLVDIGPILNTAGVLSCPNPVVTLGVQGTAAPIDLIALSPSRATGLMTVTEGVQDAVVAAGATTPGNGVLIRSIGDVNTFAEIESLTQLDLLSRPVACDPASESQDAKAYGPVWGGIRDEDAEEIARAILSN
jgi:hypothetical protein